MKKVKSLSLSFYACFFLIYCAFGTVQLRGQSSSGLLSCQELRCEYLKNPLGLDVLQPRLSWFDTSTERAQRQTAYQILVAGNRESLQADKGDLWDTGKVDSDETVNIPYAGKPLQSYQHCYWKVRVWDEHGKVSTWSEPACWSMGILDRSLWQGKWLSYEKLPNTPPEEQKAKSIVEKFQKRIPGPLFRKVFDVTKQVQSASVYICGLGYYELHLNGGKVGDHVLDPAFTNYDKRDLYVTYDVTDSLVSGQNALGVMLGNGWLNVPTEAAWDFNTASWRARPMLLLQLRIVYKDGSTKIIASDDSWKAVYGPVVQDAIREGEHYDARREQPGWDKPGFNDASWDKPQIVTGPKGVLHGQIMPPIKVIQTITPVSLTQPKPGVFIYDLGQNIPGWAQIKVSGPAGQKITLRYGERLYPDGTLDQEQIHLHVKDEGFQTDSYVLRGAGVEVWEPRFVYHGFQYVEVTGFPGKPTIDSLRGQVVHTSFQQAGYFSCSNELLNKIQQMTLWSYRGNYHGYPTDCPHREKNGWMGDAHLATELGMYNFQNRASYTKWMNDLWDEQRETGELPGIVPTPSWGYKWGNGPAWDSAYVLIPWYLYQYCGDTRILARHYDRFKRYVDYLTGKAKDHIVSIGLGDWMPAKTKTPEAVTSTGYYYVDTVIVTKIARLLGKTEDAEKYGALAEEIRKAFNKTFYKGNGIYANDSQTALSCALFQGLVDPQERVKVVDQLVANVKQQDYHIDTGILGSKYLLNSLADNGRIDVAYRIAVGDTFPGYGVWARQGATTLFEDWPGAKSLNHIVFGDIGAWFYKYLAGIQVDPTQPGFKNIIIKPEPVGDLTWVRAEYESVRGRIRSAWRIEDKKFVLDVTVPANCTATVYIPAQKAGSVLEGDKAADKSVGVKFLRWEDGKAMYEIGSGEFSFISQEK